MVGVALLMAMVIVLQFVGGMIPPIGGTVSISLVLIPIVLGSAVFGPGAGALLARAVKKSLLFKSVNVVITESSSIKHKNLHKRL